MKVKVSNLTKEHLADLRISQLKKLHTLVKQGVTKEQLIKKFTKRFVEENYIDGNYTLIGSHVWFNNAKVHISLSPDELTSLCGKELGFSYTIVSKESYQDEQGQHFTKDEIIKMDKICKKCIKSINH